MQPNVPLRIALGCVDLPFQGDVGLQPPEIEDSESKDSLIGTKIKVSVAKRQNGFIRIVFCLGGGGLQGSRNKEEVQGVITFNAQKKSV